MISTLYPTFQRWSDGGSVYIISDTHFDDYDCKLMDPDWPEPKEHIKIIKSGMKFRKNSTLIHLGDVGDPKYLKWLDMKHKILITGNHDAGASKYAEYFDEIYTGPVIISDKLILSHEPVDVSWAFNIHGHDHNKEHLGDTNHLNVCSNVIGFYSVNLGELIKRGLLKNVVSIHRQTIDRANIDKEATMVYNSN